MMTKDKIRETLVANMFDGCDGGLVTMRVDRLVDEVADILAEEV